MSHHDDEYLPAEKATHIRIFAEECGDGGHTWAIDGADNAGNYTEACWSFNTWKAAYEAAAEFTAEHLPHLMPGAYLIRRESNRRGIRP